MDQQKEWRNELQKDSDEAKARSNSRIIAVIEKVIKQEIDDRRSEHKSLVENRKGGDKSVKKAREERIETLRTEIDDRLALSNFTVLLASNTPYSRKEYLRLLKRPATIS